ncbi:MAG: LCP family protein [Acidimicrobiales bacterium]
MVRELERGTAAGVIGRSSTRGKHLAGTSSTVSPPVVAPPRRPVPASSPPRRRARRRRSARERVLKGAVIFVAVLLVLVGGAYGYLRYRLGQIRSIGCADCASVANGAPYNVLLVGSDSRVGNAAAVAQVGGQRSDTIKILHVDPASGTARLLSIPRDTYVALSGMPSGTGIATDNKINSAFNDGPGPLIQTIENTFGIPIAHFVIIDVSGMIDLVNSVHGINLDFAYPVRDYDKGTGHNMSGLAIPRVGCQTLNGTMALALARSRYYQYEERPGYWVPDGTGDLGRIQRQNVIIEAVVNKAKSSYNPLTLNAFVGSLVHDITVDNGMSSGTMISLAQRYHAFSGSSLQTATLPTTPGDQTTAAGAVEVVQEPTAQQVITQFLGTQPSSVVTAPLDSDGSPMAVPSTVTTAPSGSSASSGTSGASGSSTPTTVPGTGSFNPTSC